MIGCLIEAHASASRLWTAYTDRSENFEGLTLDAPTVTRWAAHLDWNNYSITKQGEQLLIRADVPDDIAKALAPIAEDLDHRQEVYRLLNRYRLRPATPYRFALAELPSDEDLAKDVHSARHLEEVFQGDLSEPLPGALAGVAAAVLHRAARAAIDQIPAESFAWARDLLVHFATRSNPTAFNHPDTLYSDGGDRQAALALPLIFVWPGGRLAPIMHNRQGSPETQQAVAVVSSAVEACACSSLVEVRQNVAEGLRFVLDQPCDVDNDGRCWHEGVWQAIDAGARRVVLGDFSESGRAEIRPINGDIGAELSQAADRKLMFTYIGPAAICTLDAARSKSCIRLQAEQLRGALIDAYTRSARLWAEKHYHRHKEQDAAFTSAVLRSAADGDSQYIVEIAMKLSDSPGALADYLDALVMASTYEAIFVPTLSHVWPQLMEIGLVPLRER